MPDHEIGNLHKLHAAQVVVPVKVHEVSEVRLIWLHCCTTQNDALLENRRAPLDVSGIVQLYFEECFFVLVVAIDRVPMYHFDVMDVLLVFISELFSDTLWASQASLVVDQDVE